VVAYNGSGIVSKKRIDDAKIFATTELSAMESNLRLFIDELGIQDEKIRYFGSVDNMIKTFNEGELDAVAIWEPYFSALEGYHYEFREVLGDFPCCSFASSTSFYTSRKKELIAFKEEIMKSLEKMDEELAAKVLLDFGFKTNEIQRGLKNYRYSAEIREEDIQFLEKYGFKILGDNVKNIIDPLNL